MQRTCARRGAHLGERHAKPHPGFGGFEIILAERTNAITVSYRGIAADEREQGSSATLGIENSTGSDALQYSFNVPAVQSPTFGVSYIEPR